MTKWTITYFNEAVQNHILRLPAGMLARFLRYADRMEEHGPDLGMPHVRAMGKGLFELRLNAPEGIARVFYCLGTGEKFHLAFIRQENSENTFARMETRCSTHEGDLRC